MNKTGASKSSGLALVELWPETRPVVGRSSWFEPIYPIYPYYCQKPYWVAVGDRGGLIELGGIPGEAVKLLGE